MLITILVILALSLLILGHELGHFLAAKLFKLRVDEFGFGFPPRIFARKKGETEYSINWLPFGGFVRIAGENDRIQGDLSKLDSLPPEEKKRLLLFQPAWRRSIIMLAGVAVNFLIGWLLISIVFMVGIPRSLIVADVQDNSPAQAVGIESGDVIKSYIEADKFINFVDENKGQEIEVVVQRGDEDIPFLVTPKANPGSDEGALGVLLVEGGFEGQGFFGSIFFGLKRTGQLAVMIFEVFISLIKHLVTTGSILEGIVGPVGIFGVAQQTGQLGIIYLVQLISLISINLAVINIIPFPALDGGRFVMILIEKIKGSPVPLRVEAIINGVGFALLIILMVAITAKDVAGLF